MIAHYSPASEIGWLATDDDEADEARQLMAAFDEAETLDSLGIGSIRDGIANQLFPGTSTIQTRARYFLFLPWIFLQMEKDRVPSRDFAHELRRREVALIDSLRQGCPPKERGIVGVSAGDRTRRLPSSIYWSGLGSWGIRARGVSLAEYRRTLDSYYRHLDRLTREDEADVPDRARRTWTDPPTSPPRFPHEPISLDLTRAESAYLENLIATSQTDTLLDELVRRRKVPHDAWPWTINQAGFSTELQALLRHAEIFSNVIHGAQLLYCHYLAHDAATKLGRTTTQLSEQLLEQHQDWVDNMSSDAQRVEAWVSDLGTFWAAVTSRGARIGRARAFIETWLKLVLSAKAFNADDPDTRSVIARREQSLKQGLARLTSIHALGNWNGNEIGTAQLDYRWRVTQRIVTDIAQPWQQDART